MNIDQQLHNKLLKLNIDEAMRQASDYNNPQPLIDLIDSESQELWASTEGRDTIKVLNQPRKKGRPKNVDIEFKHIQMLCFVYYLIGQGTAAYSGSNPNNACEIVAEHMNSNYDTIRDVYRKTQKTPLFEAYRKAGERSKCSG